MKLIVGLIGSVIGGIIGAAIWAAVAYYAHVEMAWIAIGVGVLAGVGMALGVKDEGSYLSGGLAAVVALLAICAGKYITVEMILSNVVKESNIAEQMKVTESDAQLYMANQLIEEAQAEGKTLKWPGGKEPEEGIQSEKDVPVAIWKDVQARWKSMDDAGHTQYVDSVQTQYDQAMNKTMDAAREEGFMASFDVIDAVFILIAVVGAFKGGAGMFDDGE